MYACMYIHMYYCAIKVIIEEQVTYSGSQNCLNGWSFWIDELSVE